MKEPPKSALELMDMQIELLENVNRRLEGMADWEKLYPARAEIIRKTLNDGLSLGSELRSFGDKANGDSTMTALLARYARFLLCYETAWISCIQMGVPVRNTPNEDPKYRVFKTAGGWMIKRPLVGWFSDFQPTKHAAIAVAEQLCRASGQGTVVVQNENNGMELSYEVCAQDEF